VFLIHAVLFPLCLWRPLSHFPCACEQIVLPTHTEARTLWEATLSFL